jgi:hypothetical protein
MKMPTRKFLLVVIIISLSITAALGITGVLWTGLGEVGGKMLGSALVVDVASILTLCCAGQARSAVLRAAQVTGTLSACLSAVAGLYALWLAAPTSGLAEVVTRTAVVLLVLAVACAHACLLLAGRPYSRPVRIVAAATMACIAAAAELIGNYAVFPGFDPGSGYLRALAAVLILDALGTIVVLILHRSRAPRSGTATGAAARHPSPGPPDAGLPAVL